ncbi:MAG: FAD-dependent oxidoreductase, partial [Gemmatimonadota bacterium]
MSEAPPSSADRRLVDNVRPADWRNPIPRERYDLVVIGAGTGGLVSAAIGAALGARVALVERRRMGGDCLNFGCVPSKGVLRAARSWAAARDSHESFGGPEVSGSGDFAAAMARMREIRSGISDVDSAERFAGMGVDVFFGEGRFDSKRSVLVDGHERLEFRRAIIATGTRPAVPGVPGLEDAGFLTNESVFELDRRPERLLVLGAGPIGCELSQAFARLGSRVVLLDQEKRILAREEPDAADLVLHALERDGVEFIGGADVTGVEGADGRTVLRYETAGGSGQVEG